MIQPQGASVRNILLTKCQISLLSDRRYQDILAVSLSLLVGNNTTLTLSNANSLKKIPFLEEPALTGNYIGTIIGSYN